MRLQPIHADDLVLASDLQLEEFLLPVQDLVWSLVQGRQRRHRTAFPHVDDVGSLQGLEAGCGLGVGERPGRQRLRATQGLYHVLQRGLR